VGENENKEGEKEKEILGGGGWDGV